MRLKVPLHNWDKCSQNNLNIQETRGGEKKRKKENSLVSEKFSRAFEFQCILLVKEEKKNAALASFPYKVKKYLQATFGMRVRGILC